MKKIPDNYLEKIYAGFLAKAIGVRLGAPVEPEFWTHDSIQKFYGNIEGYVKDYKNFAADDDTNGPIFFIRALEDYCNNRELTAEDVGNTWLNYTSEGHGMFWWGGYGISSEETAYSNLLNGIKAPQSGSIKQNGQTIAEQIGGQIFIDSWGLVWPGNIEKAAEYAEKAASVSHDGNGIYGGKFIAASIAKAFDTDNIDEIIDAGLSVVPEGSEFMRVNKAVINFYNKNPNDFRLCFEMLDRDFGYDKYNGICHMIPNAGVVTLSLLYGKGTVSKSIEIATMCGWDTDCNAGNVGSITGVAYGLDKIPDHYRKPINDFLVASSIAGSLNTVDVPTFCKELSLLGYKLADEDLPKNLKPLTELKRKRSLHFDFELPGSTHGLRLKASRGSNKIKNSDERSFSGKRCLKLSLSDHRRGDKTKLYYKPFYRNRDFDDNRYRPQFSPMVYPGQRVSLNYYVEDFSGQLSMTFYARLSHSKKDVESETFILNQNSWQNSEWLIPYNIKEPIDEVGIIFESLERDKFIGNTYIDSILIDGKANYTIDFNNESEEWNSVTQFTYNRGAWTLENGMMEAIALNNAEAYTGNYYMKDYHIKTVINPQCGISHNLAFRVKGIMMGYHVGFNGENKVALIKNDHGHSTLAEKEYRWTSGQSYSFEIQAVKNHFIFKINNEEIFNLKDDETTFFDYGMYGFSLMESGRTMFTKLDVKEY